MRRPSCLRLPEPDARAGPPPPKEVLRYRERCEFGDSEQLRPLTTNLFFISPSSGLDLDVRAGPGARLINRLGQVIPAKR